MQAKAAGQSFESANDLILEKGNQLTLDKGNKLTLVPEPTSKPLGKGQGKLFQLPGPDARPVATLGPPEGYWESFHQEWLQRVGGATSQLEGNLSNLSKMKTGA